MSLRVDWQEIRDVVNKNGASLGAPFLFILPHGGRHLLMSIMDMLRYEATYRIEDYDYSDWDELQAIVEATHYGLMDGEQVNEISEAIVYLADTLAENKTGLSTEDIDMNQTVNVCCNCCGNSSSSGSATGENEAVAPPDGYEIQPITEDEPSVMVSDGEKCNRANYLMVQYRLACLNLLNNMSTYQVFSSWWEVVTGALWGGYPPAYDMFLRLRSWAENQMVTGQFIDAYDQNHNSLVCMLYSADTANEGKEAVRVALQSAVMPNVSPILALAYMDMWENMPVSSVYDKAANVQLPASFSGRSCCGSVPLGNVEDGVPETYTLVPLEDSGVTLTGVNYCVASMTQTGLFTMTAIGGETYKQATLTADMDYHRPAGDWLDVGLLFVMEENDGSAGAYEYFVNGESLASRGEEIWSMYASIKNTTSPTFATWVNESGGNFDSGETVDNVFAMQITQDQNMSELTFMTLRVYAVYEAV